MAGEDEQSQSYDDSMGGPGAPMPLAQLEVSLHTFAIRNQLKQDSGHQWPDGERYQTLR
jgi:hypothetical protein